MSDTYFQDRANNEGKPIYVGPDNVSGGSHWRYPESKPVRLISALLVDELFVREQALIRAQQGEPSENHIPDNEEDVVNIKAAIDLWNEVRIRMARQNEQGS